MTLKQHVLLWPALLSAAALVWSSEEGLPLDGPGIAGLVAAWFVIMIVIQLFAALLIAGLAAFLWMLRP